MSLVLDSTPIITDTAVGKQIGPAIKLSPDNLVFSSPVTITVKIPPGLQNPASTQISLYEPSLSLLLWQPSRVDLVRGVVTTETMHFSIFVWWEAVTLGKSKLSQDYTYEVLGCLPRLLVAGATCTQVVEDVKRAVGLWMPLLGKSGITMTYESGDIFDIFDRRHIYVRFYSDSKIDASAKKSGLNVWAGFSVWTKPTGRREIYLNDNLLWSPTEVASTLQRNDLSIYNVERTVAHELGHHIGLPHLCFGAPELGVCGQAPVMGYKHLGLPLPLSCDDLDYLKLSLPQTPSRGPCGSTLVKNPEWEISGTVAPNSPISSPPSVLVRDGANQPIESVTVVFDVTPGSGTTPERVATTNANGVATVPGWIVGSSGEQQLQAYVYPNSVTFHVTLAPPTVELTATPSSIGAGQSSTLSWTSTYATSCAGSSWTSSTATSGSQVVSPTTTTTYAISCAGPNGSATSTATVTVTLPRYTISTSSTPSDGGSTSGGGTYTAGSSVTVIASAASGYAFVNWTESGSEVSSNATYTFTASANRSLVAYFLANPVLTVTGSGTGSGSVTSDVGGINCSITAGSASGNCSAPFNSGTNVTLTATPVSGDTFAGWSGACTGSGSCQVTMTQVQNVTASFTVSGSIVFAQVTAGGAHTCGLTSTGIAYCWGSNGSGRLGDGTEQGRLVPTPVSGGLSFVGITAGWHHTCASTSDGVAYCWGSNGSGELGDGTTQLSLDPTPVAGNLNFIELTAGLFYTCGRTSVGAAYCWGDNFSGKLGDGTTQDRFAPTPVSDGLSFVQLAAGIYHTCGRTSTGAAYCWGNNGAGALGDGSQVGRLVPTLVVGGISFAELTAAVYNTCGRTSAGVAYCWGENGNGQLGEGGTMPRSYVPTPVAGGLSFVALTAGGLRTCGLTSAGVAYCWGYNIHGQLGDGTTQDRSVPTPVAGALNLNQLTTGAQDFLGHTCGRTTAGTVYCWGYNGQGQLGDGTQVGRLVPTPVQSP